MRRALCIRFFIKSCCFINISIAFREESISKHLFPPSWKRRISRQRYLIVDYSTTNRVEETSRDQSASWMNFRGIIDQDFDKGASARRWPHPCRITNWKKVLRIRGVDAWYRKGREREKGKGDVRTLHCHVIGDGVTVLGRVDAFLIVRYVSTLRRARVACAHAFMHRIITRR